jgi:hypothetical protein
MDNEERKMFSTAESTTSPCLRSWP